MNIPDEAVEAAAIASYVRAGGGTPESWQREEEYYRREYLEDARTALEAAAPHLMAPILALCDEADSRRGSSMYCKLTTYEVRKAIGVEE